MPNTWHVISNQEGTVLAVYGKGMLSHAQSKCAGIEHQTGCPIYLHSIVGDRPRVGGWISMKGTQTCAR